MNKIKPYLSVVIPIFNEENTKIKNVQIREGCIVSKHINDKENGQTTIQMLELSENQLSNIIIEWGQLGHEIDENTINDEGFIKFLINNADIRSINYTSKVPKLFFLVKNEISEPMLYGGEIKKFFKTISFPGWFKIAGVIDEQGNYQKGFEHLISQKENLISLFRKVLSNTVKGSYTIIELYTDEKGERKADFKFFKNCNQITPTLEEPIDIMAAFGFVYLNLLPENLDNIGVKDDLTKPILEKLIAKKSS